MIEIEENLLEGISLDKENAEFCLALEYAMQTNRSLFLTGKAGSGKTTFLKYFREATLKNTVVLAPTGVAAIKAEGQTIHSFFQIAPSIYFPGDSRLRFYAQEGEPTIKDNFKYSPDKTLVIRNLQTLVIDEISMVRADLLDVIDAILRAYRDSALPFGGVQLILIGDMFQLPPVVQPDDREILSQFYENEFFFSSSAISAVDLVYVELKKIYRQSDRRFIDLLNRVRVNAMQDSDFDIFRKKLDPSFKPAENDSYIILSTTNSKVSAVNSEKLAGLPSEPETFVAEVAGDFPERDMPTDMELVLKPGAQVMFVKNDAKRRFYNGKIGKVVSFGGETVKVRVKNSYDEDVDIDVERVEWQKIRYTWDKRKRCIEEEVTGTFTQFPLRLAWAITVHKSQGLTFEKVIADLSFSFSPGQVYVALSRCVSLEGIVLLSEITPRSIFTDPRITEFAKRELPSSELAALLNGAKAERLYADARLAFACNDAAACAEDCARMMELADIPEKTVRFASVWSRRVLELLFAYRLRCSRLEGRVRRLENSIAEQEKKKGKKNGKNKNR